MGIKQTLNYPLMRELQQIGLISPEFIVQGPFGIEQEVITGGNATSTTLKYSIVDEGIIGCLCFDLSGNTLTMLAEGTDFTVSGTTFTFVGDKSGKIIIFTYCYDVPASSSSSSVSSSSSSSSSVSSESSVSSSSSSSSSKSSVSSSSSSSSSVSSESSGSSSSSSSSSA